MNSSTASATTPAILPLGFLAWLKRELAPTPLRARRTAIMTGSAVLCVMISMTLQVPELAVSAYMPFFFSSERKAVTIVGGIIGLIGNAIGIGGTILVYKVTYGHPELRIPVMAIGTFLAMWLSRVSVFGTLGFVAGFIFAVSQAAGEAIPSPELLVRFNLWLGMSVAYGMVVIVVMSLLFMRGPASPPGGLPKPKGFFKPDAFTNPAHVHFALKVTLAAMFCYIFWMAVDWPGIHTAVITCFFVPWNNESIGATFRKGVLRLGGCAIGGVIAIFTIVFLVPHMVTIASLVVVVTCVCVISGWVAAGSERIAYAGLQMAFAFFLSVFQGYAPATDLDKIRDRFIGILLGAIVTGLVFEYIWPERAIDLLRNTLRQALQQLAQLLKIPRPETSIEEAKSKAHDLIAGTSKSFEQASRHAELTRFEFEESPDRERVSIGHLETTLARAEDVFAAATSLASDQSWSEWQRLPQNVKIAESELRNVAAKRIEYAAAAANATEDADANVSIASEKWNETVQQLRPENSRSALVSRIASEVQYLQ